jgi:hypothetical protein
MKHEIKIIIQYEAEGIDSDGRTLPPIVYLDNQAVGCIQEVNFHASVNNVVPDLEIVMPNFNDENIDPAYFAQPATLNRDVIDTISNLSQVAGLKLTIRNFDETTNVVAMKEVGTDGCIELIPMKKRHQ